MKNLLTVFVALMATAWAGCCLADDGGADGLLGFALGLKGAYGVSAIVGVVARYVTSSLRSAAFLKAAPAWLVGTAPGQAPAGWRVYVLVAIASVVAYVILALFRGEAFDVKSAAAWVEVFKATAFAVFANEVLKHATPEGVTKVN